MRTVYLLLVVIYFTKTSEACTCGELPEHPHQQICDASFVIKGKPISVVHETWTDPPIPLPSSAEELFNFQSYRYRHYFVEVTKDFKDTGLQGSTIVITTPGDSGVCGLMLYNFGENPRDREWVIAGTTIVSGTTVRFRYYMQQCLFVRPWEQLTESQKRFLNKGPYLDNCDCSILQCVDEDDCDPEPENKCVHYKPIWGDDCYINDLFCKRKTNRRRGNDKCVWRGENVDQCIADNPFK